jgi:hypothetical protein
MKQHACISTCLLAAILMSMVALCAAAQSPNTASLIIDVADESGGFVPGASVAVFNEMTGARRDAVTAASGSVTVAALPVSGRYRVVVAKPGFADRAVTDIVFRAGEAAQLHVKLLVAGAESSVEVFGTAAGVSNSAELGARLDSAQIDETPVLGRKVSFLPLLSGAFRNAKGTGDLFMNSVFFVTGAGGRRQTDFVVDGATGDEPWGRQTMFSTIPVGAIQEMSVKSRAFSAEFGWTSSTAVNVVTKSGSNVTHGEGLFLGRPGGWQARSFGSTSITPPDIPDSLRQASFALGGPVVRDATHYFVAGDITQQDRTATITSPLLVTAPAAYVPYKGNYRQGLLDARVDQRLNSSNSAMVRFNLDRFYDNNPQDAISGNVLPSAGRKFSRHAFSIQANETAVLSPVLLNELRFVYQNADPVTAFDPLTPTTQFTRAGALPFTSGESRYAHVFSRELQIANTLSWSTGRHYVRLGGNLTRNSSGGDGTEFGSAYVLGQFTVNSATTAVPAQLTLADITRYTQSFNFGSGTYVLNQWLYALFIQDSYRVRRDLTVDLGLRYDRQTFSDGKKNFAPRAGFGWNPGGNSRTSVRGGYGVYYTEMRANIDANFTLGGPTGIFTYVATPGQTGFPSCLTCTPVSYNQNAAASTLPPRNITIRPGIASYYSQFFNIAALSGYANATFVNPKSRVASIGVEQKVAGNLFVAADYVRQHWTGLDETTDLNAPSVFVRTAPGQLRTAAAADATRPITPVNGGFRSINVVENLGVADYNGLQTTVRWQTPRAFVSVSYTLSKATNTTEPDGNGAGPNDFNQLTAAWEKAPSVLDQRHRAVFNASYRFKWGLTAGTMTQAASAKPFNPTTGVDNNGDGNNNDRPVINGRIASRYSFRGTATSDVAVFIEKHISVRERSIVLRAESFNSLNHFNVLGRNGTYGDTGTPLQTFGSPTPGLSSIDPSRMIQLQARFVW